MTVTRTHTNIPARVEAEIRADERARIADEMAALKRELEQADRKMAAGLVMNMWQRVTRRLDR